MPQPLQYRSGSLIYFQEDPAEKVFLLRSGAVSLVYQNIETGSDVHEMVSPGEFFGVKSALGRFPREENALVLQDSDVMAFSVQEFEALAMSNTRIIMKILKIFSNQLRRNHRQISALTDTAEREGEAGLFNVGEYYLKNRRYSLAKAVFGRYLAYYPSGKNAARAAKNMEAAEAALGREPPALSPRPVEEAAGPLAAPDPAASYREAVGLVSRGKYQQACQLFRAVADTAGDPEYSAKCSFEIGRCLHLLEKDEECIKYFTGMITRYPKHPGLGEALFFMGRSHERRGRKEQALTFYRKVVAMIGDEGSETRRKAVEALGGLED